MLRFFCDVASLFSKSRYLSFFHCGLLTTQVTRKYGTLLIFVASHVYSPAHGQHIDPITRNEYVEAISRSRRRTDTASG
jgi:hypothetical protein